MANYFDCAALMGQLTSAEMQRKLKQASGAEAYNEFLLLVNGAPVADVAPVVHGRWKLLHKGGWTSVFVCSVCGRRETITESESYNSQHKMPKEYPYCHCGARMDGDSDAKAD